MSMQADRAIERRMAELAARAARTGVAQVAWFLSPAGQAQAEICARREGVAFFAEGGDAVTERRVVAFADADWMPAWPIVCLHITWQARYGQPSHRDLLGAILGLGIDREKVGDVFAGEGGAYVFALRDMGRYIAASLTEAGRTPVQVALLDSWPAMDAATGEDVRGTVASLRLDAVLATAWHLSRGRAAELVAAGRVQVDHLVELRPDRALDAGAVLSVRGMGRARLEEVGGRTKKGRIGIRVLRY